MKIITPNAFTEKVEAITARNGLTVSQIAFKAQLPYQTVWRALTGRNNPNRGTRALIAIALNLPADYFEVV